MARRADELRPSRYPIPASLFGAPPAGTLLGVAIDTATFVRDMRLWALDVFADAVEQIIEELDDAVPVGPDRARTGPALKDTLDVRVGPDRVTIAYLAEHASFTDEDTAPHIIEGNPFLHFYWADGPDGPGMYTFRFVHHPGTTGTHWWTDVVSDDNWQNALEQAAENLRSTF